MNTIFNIMRKIPMPAFYTMLLSVVGIYYVPYAIISIPNWLLRMTKKAEKRKNFFQVSYVVNQTPYRK